MSTTKNDWWEGFANLLHFYWRCIAVVCDHVTSNTVYLFKTVGPDTEVCCTIQANMALRTVGQDAESGSRPSPPPYLNPSPSTFSPSTFLFFFFFLLLLLTTIALTLLKSMLEFHPTCEPWSEDWHWFRGPYELLAFTIVIFVACCLALAFILLARAIFK